MMAERLVTVQIEKVPFESRMAVMRVRPTYIAPYLKCRYFYLSKPDLKTKRTFVKHAETLIGNWPSGTYYLKLSSGKVFIRFDVYEGKIKKFYKESPATGKIYPIWAWIQNRSN